MKKFILPLVVLCLTVYISDKISTKSLANLNVSNHDTTAYTPPKLIKAKYIQGIVVFSIIPIGYNNRMATISIDTNGDGQANIIAKCKPNLALKILKARNMGLSITFELVFQNEEHEITKADYAYSR